MTPEGRVKREIDKLLARYAPQLWAHKPVQNGMGKPCLDYHCCYKGRYFAIEAKAAGEFLSQRQEITAREIETAGGMVFTICGTAEEGQAALATLERWLDAI
jgi:hypothetical protein